MNDRSRKQKLSYRASWYGDRNQGAPQHLAASRGYEAGYRAAMRDARKIRAEAAAPGVRSDALFDYAVAMREWLRPLR